MKTIEDLLEAIKDPDFLCKHDLKWFIYEPDQGFGKVLIQKGTTDSDKVFKIPLNISGTVDILIKGEGYDTITFNNFNVNINSQTIINIPMMLRKENYDLPF